MVFWLVFLFTLVMKSILSFEIIFCFILMSNRPDYVTYLIYLPENNTPHSPPPPLLRTELLECIMSKILYTYLFTHVYKCTLFFWNFTLRLGLENQHAYVLCTPERFIFIWSTLRNEAKYKVEQLPVLWNMENKSRQNVCLHVASCITSEFSQCISHWSHQLESRRSTTYDRKSNAFFQLFL